VDEFFRDYYGEGGDAVRQVMELALEETKDRHVSIYISLEDLYPNRVVVHHADGVLPGELTVSAVRDGGADIGAYAEWFTSIAPSVLLEKGTALFDQALASVSDEGIRRHIERSSIQIDVLRSSWRYQVIRSHRENLERALCGILGAEPGDEAVRMRVDEAVRAEEAAYREENRRLRDKMAALDVWFISEGNSMRGRDALRFDLPVTRW